MSTTETDGAAVLESYVPFTPFQDSYAFEAQSSVLTESEQYESAPGVTPFLSEYAGLDPASTPEAVELHQLLFDLYDQQFDDVLAEIAQEAWSAVGDRAEMFGETVGTETAEQFLEQWIAPVRDQAEGLLESIAEAVSQTDIASLNEVELDRLVDQFEPGGTGLEQYFEDFLSGLVKKARTLVKRVASVAKKGLTLLPGVGALLRKLKALVRPLLERVLKVALDKLPPRLRPVARQLARRLLGKVASEADEAGDEILEAAPATPDASAIQQQFDLDVATLLFADESEQELIAAEAAYEAERTDGSPIAELHDARARFVEDLEHGADPHEALERFIPAVMAVQPIARTAIRIVGRGRVVNFLAGFLAKLIEKHVPRDASRQLSQAIVDAGLRLISLEAPSDAEIEQLAPDMLAATVEDTVRRVADFDEATLGHPALLEASATVAFHEAAAENFPSQLLVSELHETTTPGAWVSMPLGVRQRKYFKKYTRVFDVQLTPQLADSLKTFGGATLTAFLKDRLGVAAPLQARVHLYQATTATSLARISKLERGTRGLGTAAKAAWTQLHPLTPEAAGMLLQEPKLGRRIPESYLSTRGRIAVGQRFYYLELAGGRTAPSTDRRSSQVNVALDFPKDEFRVFVYFSESDAQGIAASARTHDVAAAVIAAKKVYDAGVLTALGGQARRHVKILGESLPQEEFVGMLVKRLADGVRQALAGRIAAWVGKGIADQFSTRAGEFVAATEDPADGATVVVTIVNPPGAPVVRRLLRGEGIGPEALRNAQSLFQGEPRVTVGTVSGFRFD